MSAFRIQQNTAQHATLYRVVYENVYVKFAVGILFLFFLLHPAVPVFASEMDVMEPVSEPTEAQVAPETVEEVAKIEETSEVVVVEQEADVEDVQIASSPTTEQLEEVSDTVVPSDTEDATVRSTSTSGSDSENAGGTSDVATSTTVTVTDAEQVAVTVSDSSISTTTDEASDRGTSTADTPADLHTPVSTTTTTTATTTLSTSTSTTEGVVSDTTTPAVELESDPVEPTVPASPAPVIPAPVEEEIEREVASSSQETGVVSEVINVVTNDENRIQFSVDECVTMGDGSYYCNKTNTRGSATFDAVYAVVDDEGDEEIYFNDGATVTQITDNQYEDKAPSYDPKSHSIVWHRLLNGRYQIMHYDLADTTEEQLTDARVNNMEPTHEAGVTVWQRWGNENWEIVLRERDGNELQLTTNAVHDIAPDIQGDYVIWHTNNMYGERQVAVYEISSGLTSYIADNEGGQVLNPRFVLMYDTQFENGDVVTKGFNPETGETVPLSAQAGEIPVHVPAPTPTGEETVLLQNKSPNSREDFTEMLKPTSATGTVATSTPSPSALVDSETDAGATTTVQTTDVVLTNETSLTEDPPLPLTDFDIIVEPYTPTTTPAVISEENVATSSEPEA